MKILPITNKTYSLARVLQDEMMIEKPLVINQHDKTMEMLSIQSPRVRLHHTFTHDVLKK